MLRTDTSVGCTQISTCYLYAADNFTDAAVSNRINGEHKEKDLEPWEGGEANNSDSLESLDTDVVGGRRQLCSRHTM